MNYKENNVLRKEIITAILESNFYDWLCQNYHRLSQFELLMICKEYVYQVERFNPVCTIDNGTAVEEIAGELQIYWS